MTRSVLIVDDAADFRLSLKSALELAGYDVSVAANGEEAVAAQRRTPAGVLLTDLFMPEVDGFETIDAFHREFPQVKIIAMSGGSQLVQRGDYLSSAALIGVDATLQKPFKVEVLLRILEAVLGAPEAKGAK